MSEGFFVYNGVSSLDLGITVVGTGTYPVPARNLIFESVPGRSGDLIVDQGNYPNVRITYHCTCLTGLSAALDSLAALLMAQTTYQRLEDSYHTDIYRMAICDTALSPDVFSPDHGQGYKGGNFDITFNCRPQKWLKSGETPRRYSATGSSALTLQNPTPFSAAPLLHFGAGDTGEFEIYNWNTRSGVRIFLNAYSENEDRYVDCETQDVYGSNGANLNSTVTFSNGRFSVLRPGNNSIYTSTWSSSGDGYYEITPRWWKL